MANLLFNGFGANMFLPFYGSDTIEAVVQKLGNGQTDGGTASLTQIVFHTTGGFPAATFTLTGRYNEAAPLSSVITAFTIAAQGSISDTDGEFVQISAINQTFATFVNTGPSTGPLGGNDTIDGSGSYHEILRGMGGNDTLNGGGNGGDILFGDAGNDTLVGSGGPFSSVEIDQLFGGAGNDTYSIFWDGDILKELPNQGIDTVETFASYALTDNVENLTLVIGAGDINGTGNELANVISGNAGANVLDGGLGADTMTGGAGNDTYIVDNTLDKVQELIAGVPGGIDNVKSSITYTLGANVENLTLTGSANLNATGNTLANTLTGNDGDNILNGGAGIDTLIGGLGNDTYVIDSTDVITEIPGDGNDTAQVTYNASATVPTLITLGSPGNFLSIENLIVTGTGLFNLTGNDQSNSLTGNASANTLIGLEGNDTLDGGLGNDTLIGGIGNDTYLVNSLLDVVTENPGEGTQDTVKTTVSLTLANNVENLTLLGAAVINATGNAGVNILTGNSAANILNGGIGADTMIGGAGNDTYVVDNALDVTTEAPGAAGGVDLVQASVSRALGNNSNVENLTLTGTGDINGTGNELANVITGNAGANILDGGAGADTMTGGAGNDTYVVDNALDKVVETLVGVVAGGSDTVQSSVTYTLGLNVENLTLTGSTNINATGNTLANTLTGNDGNNVLLGLAGDDTLVGGEGDDTLDGGLGNDAMAGGAGNDTYVLDNALGDAITEESGAGSGVDTVKVGYNNASVLPIAINLDNAVVDMFTNIENVTITGTGSFNLVGNEADNILIGNASSNMLVGNAGNDTLDGGLGDDDMFGGFDDDTYFVNSALDTTTEGEDEGTDTVNSTVTATLATNIENLTLLGAAVINATGNAGVNILTGNSAANILNGGIGVDTMIGGAGNDTYVVDNALDVTTEAPGAAGGVDLVQASVSRALGNNSNVENLTLTGTGDINGTGNELANVITGNAGANILDGGAGADTMTGGAGNDTYVVDNALDKVVETLVGVVAGGSDTVQSSVTYTLGLNVENLTLTGSTNINATGNTLANTLTGNDGNNVLLGLAGDDTLVGGEGDDTLDGGLGNDAMAGGAGNDTYVLDNALGDAITEALGDGNDTARIAYGNATLTPVSIALGAGIFANVENLTVTGTGLFNLTGDTGDNILTGNASVNTLTGNDGNDILDGGLGNDILDGGDGNDTYILNGADTISLDSAGNDTVKSALTYSIDLRPDLDNITLLGAAVINATGNAGVNILTGNSAANILNGGIGVDTMIGGAGNDTYVVDNALDVTTEAPGAAGGVDLVQASVSRALGNNSNVENLTLTGTGDINGTGNELANVITGNAGANILDGGAGADTMTGGAGNDTYVVDNALDKVVETLVGVVAGGSDTVQSSVTYTLGLNVENLTLTGSTNINATGNTLANTLTGNDGNNVLLGLAGDDTLVGGEGDDTLDGGLGNDAMAGGAGNDTYVLDNALGDAITEALGDGNDTARIAYGNATLTPVSIALGAGIFANVENLTVTGTGLFNLTGDTGDNILTGNASVNTLTGNDGNDILDGGLGNDILDGGDGNDTYILNGADTISLDSAGNDTVKSALTYSIDLRPDLDNITLLGAAVINATGNAGVNILTGNSAANILNGGIGADTMIGGAGNDTYVVDNALDVTTEAPGAAGGVDLVQASVSRALGNNSNVENLTLTGTGDINGTGNELANVITGNAGANILDGGAGADTMTGGAGNDTYVVDNALDKVVETLVGVVAGGSDTVQSSVTYTLGLNVENLTLTGSTNINATGNTLANTLTGNDGNNRLDGGAGADVMAGGLGDDTYVIDNLGDTVNENVNEGSDTILIAGRHADLNTDFLNIENVTLTGVGVYNIFGSASDNILIGNASANMLLGNDGNDTLDGGLGDDILNGGTGDDTYFLGMGDGISSDISGIDTVITPRDDFILGVDLENLTLTGAAIFGTGNASANTITGNAAANLLAGLDGDDILIGNAGDDLLDGGDGNDALSGGIGNDLLMGGAGNDSLSGEVGDDTLAGGVGNDTLDGGAGANTLMGGTGDDLYILNSEADIALELSDEGTDTVLAGFSLSVSPAFVEIVQLTGHADLNITGNSLDNHLIGNDGNNILAGGAGNDTLEGGSGADIMVGGLGDDTFIFDSLADTIVELPGGGNDTLVIGEDVDVSAGFANLENVTLAGTGNFSITGNDLDNHLVGNSGNNTLAGGNGNDVLDGGQGVDDLTGGSGDDTYVIDNPGDVFHENSGQGSSDTVQTGLGSVDLNNGVYANIENATLLGAGAFNLTGTAGNNILIGNTAANILDGGNGNDSLDGGAGGDQMTGGSGDDLYFVDNGFDQVIEAVSGGTDTVRSNLTDYNLPADVENGQLLAGALTLHGNAFGNTLVGNELDNFLDGAGGVDTMIGGLGNDGYSVDDINDSVVELANEGIDHVGASIDYTLGNNIENLGLVDGLNINGTGNGAANVIMGGSGINTLDGGQGNDQLFGNGGNDTLLGGAGNDYFEGGAGRDILTGDDGDDTFLFDSVEQDLEVSGGTGIDTLQVPGNMNLTITDDVFTGFEVIDMKYSQFSGHNLTLAASDVINMSDTDSLLVKARNGDVVSLSGAGWHAAANVTVDGTLYHTWTTGDATLHVEDGALTIFV